MRCADMHKRSVCHESAAKVNSLVNFSVHLALKQLHFSMLREWGKQDLNLRPAGYESASLCNSEQTRVNQNRIFLSRKSRPRSGRFLKIPLISSHLRKKCGKISWQEALSLFQS